MNEKTQIPVAFELKAKRTRTMQKLSAKTMSFLTKHKRIKITVMPRNNKEQSTAKQRKPCV